MIEVTLPNGVWLLRWFKNQWRDKAGHVWVFSERTGAFYQPRHGTADLNDWSFKNESEVKINV